MGKLIHLNVALQVREMDRDLVMQCLETTEFRIFEFPFLDLPFFNLFDILHFWNNRYLGLFEFSRFEYQISNLFGIFPLELEFSNLFGFSLFK